MQWGTTFKQLLRLVRRRRFVRYTLLAANLIVLGGVTVFVLTSSPAHKAVRQNAVTNLSDTAAGNPLDKLSSADVAANVASLTRLEEATSVANYADSVNAELTIVPSDAQIVTKPQIVSTASKSWRDIQKYTVVEGDTISSLASKFGVTSDSLRWSNDVTGDQVAVGRELWVLPGQSGIIYVVKNGDTPESLASRYRANKDLLVVMNDAEGGLQEGRRIIIPDGLQPQARSASSSYSGFSFGTSAIYGYNGYYYGWCTWWAAKRRADIGRPVPANLGDAWTWASRAAAAGIGVGGTPTAGAVIMTKSGAPGHVGFVETVNDDGSIWVSDMNSRGQVSPSDPRPAGGWARTSWRHVTPDQFGRFRFIY